FFQAEDGIRARNVTGVQTCALPIWPFSSRPCLGDRAARRRHLARSRCAYAGPDRTAWASRPGRRARCALPCRAALAPGRDCSDRDRKSVVEGKRLEPRCRLIIDTAA